MVNRGEVWWASIAEPTGSGPGFRRPVLIVSDDTFNGSKIATVIAAVITSNLRLAEAPGNVRLPAAKSGLPKASVVNVSQLLTLDKRLLTSRAGKLARHQMESVSQGLRLALSLL
jgi:mRNA interferase MazF